MERTESQHQYRIEIDQIKRFLPHRSPFLLVDRILEIDAKGDHDGFAGESKIGTKVVGIKNMSYSEPHFQGHFPSRAITPGVLLIETMAQVASFVVYPAMSRDLDRMARDFQCILVGVDGARFRRPVVPGDTLRVEATLTRCRGRLWSFDCVGYVDGQKAVEAELLANLIANDGGNPAGVAAR